MIGNRLFAQVSNSPSLTRLPAVDTPIQVAQLPESPLTPATTVPVPTPTLPPRSMFRRIQIFPRSEGMGPSGESLTTPTGEKVAVVSGGVNVVVQGLSIDKLPATFGPLGDIDIEADRVVIWGLDTSGGVTGSTQSADTPLEIYMEGNIIFRQGDRTVYADRMFYDVRRQIGITINGELIAPVPQINNASSVGLVRLRASVLRQLDNAHFTAENGLITTSRIEDPTYAFTGDEIQFEDLQHPVVDPITGAPAIDPATGQPVVAHQRLAQSTNNFLYIGDVPVFYWPTMNIDLDDPHYYIDSFRFRHDSIFGYQTLFGLDAFQLLGMKRPEGVKWDLDLDYMSARGFGYGTGVEYARDSFFSIEGPTTGRFDAWFISDHGHDNLGRERRDIVPEEKFRGDVFWNHRQHIVGGPLDDWVVQGEVGWLSDRTFEEEYHETEWDENPDQLTGVRLKHTYDNQALSIEVNGRINDFFTQTQWLPRLDHYWLGEPLVDDQLTWYEHSSAAYTNIGVATMPSNPTLASQFERFPWEDDSNGNPISGQGERFVTRQELDYPLDFAPFKVVPFVMGELYHAGDDINGNPVDRAYINTGVRASIPFWYADPSIHEPLFNLNGLAHKVVFDAQFSYADATQDVTRFPLYDELEDDSIEEFQRRLFFDPFGGILPGQYYIPAVPGSPSTIDPKFDPRFYALRYGLQDWVTSPSSEIADDLTAIRFGMHHRLQTKHGAPGEERIADWMTFDADATVFPNATRDDAGATVGLINYDWHWFLGDRFSILSDGYADTFGDGLKTASIGMLLSRPKTGNFYLGFRGATGLFEADVVTAAVNYRMTEKYIGSVTSSVDFGPTGNIGQSFSITRIGESLITTVGANADASKGTVGAHFLIEPRFLPKLNTTSKTGIEIAPVGAYGLE
jgi:hypothetical protein